MEGKEGRDEDIRIRGEKCIKKISLAHIMLILPLRRVARKATKRNIFVLVVFLDNFIAKNHRPIPPGR